MTDTSLLDSIIVGRIDPHIYAFRTKSIPDYLKVGDTYRSVKARLDEWKSIFPNLEKQFEASATINDDIYFRDYSVHHFLECDKKKHRLTVGDLNEIFPECQHYSNEFFRDVSPTEVKEAISDIKKSFAENNGKYQFYNTADKSTSNHKYERSTIKWDTRPNQQEAIENFIKAEKSGRKNLLMYAVMRFGKSFTSLCCAKEMYDGKGARFVVVVSAKADVKEEWKRTTEIPANFSDYDFLDSNDLDSDENAVKKRLKNNRRVVIFLTLQDLHGNTLKEKHREIFRNKIDLLIIDETHFGARGTQYGKVLLNKEMQKDFVLAKKKDDDSVSEEEMNVVLKYLDARIRLHLSGTPYRILMGNEFSKEDIISFCQFSDIVREQKKWDADIKNAEKDEWKNPYYGFPQMVRFAFNPNESARKKLLELKNGGETYAFSALFKPFSLIKDEVGELHKKFVHEKEILDLLEVIDGSKKDGELLGFLDYDKIKLGKMCHHIVVVLPYCASCDALQSLIIGNARRFKNLSSYKIINISGVDKNEYKTVKSVRDTISQLEKQNKKTLTLTVNRMLTGTTVAEWDTMLYFKDTASPQEYDQAIFRLQNQYIKVLINSDGQEIKFNMKPQTLLVDFDPMRLFRMQEQKSLIHNINTDMGGNSQLENRIAEELRISPIIAVNKNRLVEITPKNILEAVSNYSASRGVADETVEIPIDFSLLDFDEIKTEIEKQGGLGTKEGFSIKNTEGDGTDLFVNSLESSDNENFDDETADGRNQISKTAQGIAEITDIEGARKSFEEKWRTYYARILFFAFLTKDTVVSLEQIIKSLNGGKNQIENKRIFKNLALNKTVLFLIQKNMAKFALNQLDFKIQNINCLSNDTSVAPLARAAVALKKFGRLSENEVVTPEKTCDEMAALFSDKTLKDFIKSKKQILDINSKIGEFSLALYKRFLEIGFNPSEFCSLIYAIPSSHHTYEFTRKIYEILGLPVQNIAEHFVSYDLLKIRDERGRLDCEKIKSLLNQEKPFAEIKLDDKTEGETDMKFEAVVGNPPYQEERDDNGRKPPIYNLFMDISHKSAPKSMLITPARFLFNAGQTPKEWNDRILNDTHFKVLSYESNASNIFPNTEIKGGIAISLYDNAANFNTIGVFSAYKELNSIRVKVFKNTHKQTSLENIISSQGIFRFTEEALKDYPQIETISGRGTGDKIVSKIIEQLPDIFSETKISETDIQLLAKGKSSRITRFISRKYIQENKYTDSYNVLLPESNGNGAFEVFSSPIIAEPGMGFADTFIAVGIFEARSEAENALKYIKSKFARAMLGIKKVTQHNPKATWEYVPLQDFTADSDIDWSRTVSDIDSQLYAKYELSDEEISFIESKVKAMK